MTIEPHDDGLALPVVGRWAKRKYHFLGRYLRMFSTGMKNKWPERHYIDLFAGAGFVRIRDTSEIIAGSPVLAANMPDSFSGLHMCERDKDLAQALGARIGAAKPTPRIVHGDANHHVDEILKQVPTRGCLSITFADPFGLHLDFETVRKVAQRRSDLIILLADNMDALRNWAKYYLDNPESTLDRFMGEQGWRDALLKASSDRQAAVIRDRYVARLREDLGYAHIAFERVQNDQGREIYTLVYASRSAVGLKFWKEASSIDEGGQRSLGF